MACRVAEVLHVLSVQLGMKSHKAITRTEEKHRPTGVTQGKSCLALIRRNQKIQDLHEVSIKGLGSTKHNHFTDEKGDALILREVD